MDDKDNTSELVVVDVRRYKRVKKALAESEERYRQLFENVPIGIYRTTPDGRFIDSNPAMIKMLGYNSFDELAALNLEKEYFDVNYPRSRYITMFEQDGEIMGVETVWKKKDGSLIHVRENAKLVRGESGQVFFEGTVEDITQSKKAEEAQRVRTQQIEILNCIISKGNMAESLQDMLEVILDCVVVPLAFDTAGIFRYDHKTKVVCLQARRGVPTQFALDEKYMAIDNLPFSAVLQRGQSVFVDDARTNHPYFFEKWGWRMAGSVPLVAKGRVVGALNVASCRRDAFTPEEKDILEMIGKEAGTLVSKLQTETALRDSEKYYRTLIDTSPDIIAVMDLDARLFTVNQQFLKVGGYFYDEVIGKSTYDFVSGLDPVLLAKRTTQFIKKESTSGSEYPFKKKDGQAVPLDVAASLLYDDAGKPAGIIAIGRDISERKQAALKIEEKNKMLAILNQISLELAEMPPEGDINEYISRKLMDITHAIYVGVNRYNKDTRQLEFVSANTASMVLNKATRLLGRKIDDFKFDVSEATYKEIVAEIVGYRNSLHEASFGAIPETASSLLHRMFKIDKFIGMALVSEGELIGTALMAIVQGTPAVSEELLKSFSHIVSVSLRRRQAEFQLAASEEKFKKLFYISPDSILLSRLDDSRIVSVNKGITKILGYEESEVVGKTYSDIKVFKNPEDRLMIIDMLRTKGVVENIECGFVSKSGKNSLGLVSAAVQDINGEKYVMATIRDISERKKADDALRESEEKFRSIAEQTGDLIAITNADGIVTYASSSARTLFQFEPEEMHGRNFVEFLDAPSIPKALAAFRDNLEHGGRSVGLELTMKRKDGSLFAGELNGSSFQYLGKYGSLVVIRDIDQRKRDEQELKQSKALIDAVVDNVPLMIFLKEATDLKFVLFNRAGEELLGYSREKLLGKNDLGLFPAEQADFFMAKDREALDGEVDMIDIPEEPIMTAKRGKRMLHTRKICIRGGDGTTKFLLGISEDITERKEAEAKLLAYQEQLRALTSELTLIEEKERRRIASELHDQIGQNLALCKLKVAALEKSASGEELKGDLSAVRRLLECSIQDTRSLIFDLSPPVLYELGFQAALEWLVEWIGEQYHVPVEFENRSGDEPMENDRQVILFQVVRELLVNVGKHSQASQAKVIMSLEKQALRIQVNDDGIGFDATQIYDAKGRRGGFGFFSMRERLNYLGGSLNVRSKPGQGSQIILSVPQGTRPQAGFKEDA